MVEPDLANFGQLDGLVSAPEDELRCTFVAPARYGFMAPAAELMLKHEWLHCEMPTRRLPSSAHPT